MNVVEVVDGLLTAPWVGESLAALALRFGHKPVRAKDTPGFIVNHAGRGYGTEALRILTENVAEFYVVDRILREGAERPGAFESHLKPVGPKPFDECGRNPRHG